MLGTAPNIAQKPLSVSALTHRIKDILETEMGALWVEGEVSQLNHHRSGHVYLSLKDKDARIDAVIWRSTASRLRYRPEPGEKVQVRGRLSVYAPHGAYKLVIDSVEPAGLGALQAALDALKRRLSAEGLFEQSRKKTLPLLPRAVGVITSATSAARRDIEAVLFRRSPHTPIILYPALVQGEEAANDVARGLERLAARPDVDVIIVTRGGGSLEDLWAFNEEVLVRAIARCSVPVISAVGHETDFTIADLVADHRAPTPSAGAEAAVPVRDDLLYTLDMLSDRVHRGLESLLADHRRRLFDLRSRLAVGVAFHERRLTLARLLQRAETILRTDLRRLNQRSRGLEQRLADRNPAARVARAKGKLSLAESRAEAAITRDLQQRREAFLRLTTGLEALSPLASLDRGYSITKQDGRVISSYQQVEVNAPIRVLFQDGFLTAVVESKGPGRPHISKSEPREN